MQGNYGLQPLPQSGNQHAIQPVYYGFIGAYQQTKYNQQAALGLGITQMIIGIICLILNIVLMAFAKLFFTSYITYGIWGGILIFIAGLIQILSAKKVESKCLIIGTMVMTVIAACSSAIIFGFSIFEAGSGDDWRKQDHYYSGFYYNFSYSKSSPGVIRLALGILLAALAFVEAAIAITTSVLCCGAVCNKSSEMSPIPVCDVGNQPVIFQTYHPGMVLQSGQSFFPSQPSTPHAPVNPFPQVSTKSGLTTIDPPSYDADWNPESYPQQPQSTYGKY